jgi:hypothetical protein
MAASPDQASISAVGDQDEMDVGDSMAAETSDIGLVAFTNDRRAASM